MSANVVNAILFQACWFACVLGGARGISAWGLVAVACLAASVAWRGSIRRDALLLLIAVPVGLFLDSLWIAVGILDYGTALAPTWIVVLWAAVALTLNHSLAFLQSRPWLGGLLAGLSAPFSYLMGARLEAVVVPHPWLLAVVGVAWLFVFVGLFALARRLADRASGIKNSDGGRFNASARPGRI